MSSPIEFIEILVPLIVLFGVSILVVTLVHILLAVTGNRFATEISSLSGLAAFVSIQLLLVIDSVGWLAIMMAMVIQPHRPKQ